MHFDFSEAIFDFCWFCIVQTVIVGTTGAIVSRLLRPSFSQVFNSVKPLTQSGLLLTTDLGSSQAPSLTLGSKTGLAPQQFCMTH